MVNAAPSIQDIQSTIARREKNLFKFSVALSVLLIAGTALFLFYTAVTLSARQAALERVNNQLVVSTKAQADAEAAAAAAQAENRRLQGEVADANRQLAELAQKIEQSASFARHLHPLNLQDSKDPYFGMPSGVGDAMVLILKQREKGVGFNLSNTPDKGFTSPGFATFILKQLNRPALDSLAPTDRPQIGDLVLYGGGFALFLFKDHVGKPFVLGMTPLGIIALEPDFGVPKSGVLRTNLSNIPSNATWP